MSILGKLFGGGTTAVHPRELTAREGYELSKQTLMEAYPVEAGTGYLCCLYTSVLDSNITISEEGKCQAWHFDFFLPSLKRLFLVRIQKGKIKTREKAWDKTKKAPVQYTSALYGMTPHLGMKEEPLRLRENWADTPQICNSLKRALEPHYSPKHGEEYAPVTLCMPAEYLIDLQSVERLKVFHFPFPGQNNIVALCTTDEVCEEDCFLFYIDASTGEIQQTHMFRYPKLWNEATSKDW